MLKLSAEIAAHYTPEQQVYIERYAAGLLITWLSSHVPHLISPTVGDGFHTVEAEEIFGDDNKLFEATSEVCGLVDSLYISLARQVGFTGDDDTAVWQAAVDAAGGLVGVPDKYPTFPENVEENRRFRAENP